MEILPEPFWGNVLDAKIVILTKNPGYVYEKNYTEYEKLTDENKTKLIKSQCELMSLKGTQFIPENPHNSISDYYWDKRTKKLREKYPNANSEIAMIQYIGYTSEFHKDFPKKITIHWEDANGLLYTQQFTVRLVKYLMQQNRVIIIARGKEQQWLPAIPELANYSKLIVLNNRQQTYITNNNCTRSGKWHLIEEALEN